MPSCGATRDENIPLMGGGKRLRSRSADGAGVGYAFIGKTHPGCFATTVAWQPPLRWRGFSEEIP